MFRRARAVKAFGLSVLALSCDGTVTETPLYVYEIVISGAVQTLPVGETVQLQALPLSASGRGLSGRPVIWTTSNSSIASITQAGLVIALTPGNAAITATSDLAAKTVSLTVTPSCTLSLTTPLSTTFGPTGGSGHVIVSSGVAGCSWTASTDQPWVTLPLSSGITTGSGSSSINYSVGSYSGTTQRTAVISVTVSRAGTATFAVTQTPAYLTISGRVLNAGSGVGGATIMFSGPGGGSTTTAPGSGIYSMTVPAGYTGSATPSRVANACYNPSSLTYSNVTSALSDRDYQEATCLTTTLVIPTQNCTVGASCNFTPVTASGGTTPYTWAASGGVMPNGMSFNTSTGAFSGTPTNSVNTSLTVMVTDAAGSTSSKGFTLNVSVALTTTLVLPTQNCIVGSPCDFTPVTASGGTTPYAWTASGGVMPSGMSFHASTGEFIGTPSNSVNTTFTVTVTDAAGATSSKSFALNVTGLPTVSTQLATNVTQSGFQINGLINPNGVQTTGHFEWSASSSTLGTFNSTNPIVIGLGASAVALTAQFVGMPCGTTYYYRAVAVTPSGTLVRGGILSVTTNACSTQLGTGFGPEQFTLIRPGTFQMGSSFYATGHELPVHTVNITSPFRVQRTEVTQGQWRAVMGANPSLFPGCGDTCPVDHVSWNDVQTFLQMLNAANPGANYRLPTEAEWEYAARAGTSADYGGNGVLNAIGWYGGNSGAMPHPVGQKLANAWGIYDMSGNVWEWVHDWYSENYYAASALNDPQGPLMGMNRALRGGSWYSIAEHARSAVRNAISPTASYNDLGFRLVRSP